MTPTFSDHVLWKRTPVALAVLMAQGLAVAQTAANTTSADTPEAGQFTGAEGFRPTGTPYIGPRPFTSIAERLTSPANRVDIKVAGDNMLADGITGTDVVVELRDGKGDLLRGDVEATIEVDGGARILLPGRLTSESAADKGDINRIEPGIQAMSRDGVLRFKLIAPYKPDPVNLKVSVRGVGSQVVVRYVPDLRELLAVGLLEGRLRSDQFNPSQIVPVRENDGFDQDLRGFSREFNGGATKLGARAALYLKGKVKGEYLLTMTYDSDKPTAKQLFSTIDPNAFYPVYGDSSVRGVDAQSAGKLYVRIDKRLSSLIFGDITTQESGNPARQLSQYSRALNGVRGHYEEGALAGDAFYAKTSLSQVVDEFPGRGVSGPYAVSRSNGVTGSERIEILVRDRNRPTVILKNTPMTRSYDYEFEPFSGQILFKSAIPSLDDQGNPVTIRVTYEVDQGGPTFAVVGGDLRLKATQTLTIGVAAAQDKNPVAPYEVQGANLHLKLSKQTEVIAEVARSHGTPSSSATGFQVSSTNQLLGAGDPNATGTAARLEVRHSGEDLRVRAYGVAATNGFNNPSAGITANRADVGVSGSYRVTPRITANAEVLRSDDHNSGSETTAATFGADLKLSDKLTIGAGARHVKQSAISLVSATSYTCVNSAGATVTTTPGYNAGYGINQGGTQQIDPATGLPMNCTPITPTTAAPVQDLDRNSLYARGSYRYNERLGFTAEVQREMGQDSTTLYRLGADWRVAEKTRLYSRYEHSRTFSGAYGLGVGAASSSFALGVDTQYMQEGSLFSEYRIADSASGRDAAAAMGLRNGWNIAEGFKVLTNVERLTSAGGNSMAAGVGATYTANPLWKLSGRVELRHSASANNVLLTMDAARKIDRNWTLLGREYLSLAKPISNDPTVSTATTTQNRSLVGIAYRPVDNNKFDALASFEHRLERAINSGTNTQTDVGSVRANYHPSRPWFISGRFAFKRVSELLLGSVQDSYTAALFGGRVTYDITNTWSVGAITTMLVGQGGAIQYAYGLEVGYTVMDNLLMTVGYNWRGFSDRTLTDTNYTNRGWVLGLRYKFDESVFGASNPDVNKTLSPAPAKP